MQVFLINLDRSPERLEFMDRQFRDLGVAYERVAAIDGRLLSSKELDRWCPGGELAPAEIGCFLSHRTCWGALLASGDQFAVVFEDDVELAADLACYLAADEWVPQSADIVKLETSHQKVLVEWAATSALDGRGLFRLLGRHAGTGGYVFSRDFATKALDSSHVLRSPVDHFMLHRSSDFARTVLALQMDPAVCRQLRREKANRRFPDATAFESLIVGERRAWAKSASRNPICVARRELGRPFGQLFDWLRPMFSGYPLVTRRVIEFRASPPDSGSPLPASSGGHYDG